jgi:hypothetical protein
MATKCGMLGPAVLVVVIVVAALHGLGIGLGDEMEDKKLQSRCLALIHEYGFGWQLAALPPSFRQDWTALKCDDSWITLDHPEEGVAGKWNASDGGWRENNGGLEAGDSESVCSKPCVDSWSPGMWVQNCAHGEQCAFNFVPEGQDCLYEIFTPQSTAKCMKDKWLLILGSSGAMNLALTWMMALDADGTVAPFEGPRWYSWPCYESGSCPDLGTGGIDFVNYKNMKIDLVFGPAGEIIWKGGRGKELGDAPEVPMGGWRLTALPVQWAVEVKQTLVTALKNSRFERWRVGRQAAVPMVYVQIGQWHLNAFDGKSIKWLARSSKWGINTTELYSWAAVPTTSALAASFRTEMASLVSSLINMGVETLAVAGMPSSAHACRQVYLLY